MRAFLLREMSGGCILERGWGKVAGNKTMAVRTVRSKQRAEMVSS